MNAFDVAQIAAALGAGSVLPWLVRRLRRDPKSDAEARKINAEASRTEWRTLRDEIDRLTDAVEAQGRQINELKEQATARLGREEELEKENKQLRTAVGRLRKRVEGLEAILKITLPPDDMKAKLAELDDEEE